MSHHHPGNLTLPTISSQVASTGLPDCPGARMSFTLGQAKGPCFLPPLYVYMYVYVCICM